MNAKREGLRSSTSVGSAWLAAPGPLALLTLLGLPSTALARAPVAFQDGDGEESDAQEEELEPMVVEEFAPQDDVQAQLDALARQNEELRARVVDLEQAAGDAALVEEELAEAEESDERLAKIPGIGFSYGDVTGQMKIFGDLDFGYADPAPEGEGDNHFGVGVLDFFLTAEVGDHFQILSETKVEGFDAATVFSQERLWGAYRLNEAFYVKMGMEHSGISRWNRLYHHGAWLELSISRPFIAEFEGDGGILPLHNIGIEVGGQHDVSAGRFDYYAAIANGRAELPSQKTIAFDPNDAKAVEFYAGFVPAAVEDLHFGATVRYDEIPPDGAGFESSLDSLIATGFAQYRHGPISLLSEYGFIWDEDESSSQDYDSTTGYAQLGYSFGDLTPYLRLDFKNMAEGDTFYARQDRDLDRYRNTLGLRYDFNRNAALKLEFDFGKGDVRDEAGVVSEVDMRAIALQMSWVI